MGERKELKKTSGLSHRLIRDAGESGNTQSTRSAERRIRELRKRQADFQ